MLSAKQKNPQSQQKKHTFISWLYSPNLTLGLNPGRICVEDFTHLIDIASGNFQTYHTEMIREAPCKALDCDFRTNSCTSLCSIINHKINPIEGANTNVRTYYCTQFNIAIRLISRPMSILSEATCAEKSYQYFKTELGCRRNIPLSLCIKSLFL